MIRTRKRQLEAILLLAIVSIGGSAQLSSAAIMLQNSAPTPFANGLFGITVSAVGTAGETINTFTGIRLDPGFVGMPRSKHERKHLRMPRHQRSNSTHQVYGTMPGPPTTPTSCSTLPKPFQRVLSLPKPTMVRRPGHLECHPTTQRSLRRVVLGRTASSATSAKVVLAPNADSNVPFMYVVLRRDDLRC